MCRPILPDVDGDFVGANLALSVDIATGLVETWFTTLNHLSPPPEHFNQRSLPMAKGDSPQYVVHAVSRHNGRDYWTRCGVAFANDNGSVSILLNPGVAAIGKLILLANEQRNADDDYGQYGQDAPDQAS